MPLDDYRTLLQVEHCDVILDEVTGVASSRESMGLPAAVGNRLVQLRRADIALRWTAPSWKRADTIIRECSQAVTLCMGFLPKRVTREAEYAGPHGFLHGPLLADSTDAVPTDMYACRIEEPHSHDEDRQWSSKRLFYWRTYDAATFDEWTTYRKEKVRPMARQLFLLPGAVAPRAYDTYDSVLSLGTVTDAGLCMDCAGHRDKKKCTCETYRARKARESSRGPSARRSADLLVIPETDYTPAVAVEL